MCGYEGNRGVRSWGARGRHDWKEVLFRAAFPSHAAAPVAAALPGTYGAARVQRRTPLDGMPAAAVARTLDLEHAAELGRLRRERERAVALRGELCRRDAELVQLRMRAASNPDAADFDALGAAQDARGELAREVEDACARGDELAYYTRTADIMFKYYDAIQASLPCPTPSTSCQPPSSAAAALHPSSILRFFVGCPPALPAGDRASDANTVRPSSEASRDDDRATLLERYMAAARVDAPPVPQAPAQPPAQAASAGPGLCQNCDACRHCGSTERSVILQDGYMVCRACHSIEYLIVDHERPSFRENSKDAGFAAYKRINHFNEWLNQVQGKETTEIPDDVYDSILLEIKKQKLGNMAELTPRRVKDILRKLRINKYYEHIPHIINRINGMPSPHFPQELEDRLRHMFCQIQGPFLRFSPSQRKNFLSYSFCLHKMMQLLEKDQYLSSFPLLKSREKLQQQDQIWRKICDELGWDFIPSL